MRKVEVPGRVAEPFTRRQCKQLDRIHRRERRQIAKVLKQERWVDGQGRDMWPWWFQIELKGGK